MRLLILQRFTLSAVVLVWLGLFATQVVQGPRFRVQAEKNRTRLIHLPAPRGAILDRHGVPLVEDRLSFDLVVFPRELKNPQETWGRLFQLVGIHPELLADRYRRGYEAPFSFVPIVRDLQPETAFLLEEKKAELAGTFVRPVPRRRYLLGAPLGSAAGYVGLIAPEELTRLKPYGYSFRDFIGKDGLEQMYDPTLRGRDGGLLVEVDVKGRLIRQLGFRRPQAGRAITVSLDGRLQSFCYQLLSGQRGAILVMDTLSGEILGLVSSPSFDPNAFLDPKRRLEVQHLLRRSDRPMFNRATQAHVPPGSTFKMITAYGALKGKKISSMTTFECPGFYQVGRATFRCWKEEGHGSQNVLNAIEHSCNVFFYNTGRRLKAQGLAEAAKLFGLGRLTGIDIPRESKGLVPDPQWFKATFHQAWQEGDTVSFAIGQGPLQVTPLQMLLVTTAVAMNGRVPHPHLLVGVERESHGKVPPPSQIPLDPEMVAKVQIGMEQAVSSPTGTGRLAQLPGVRVAAKTGTAQVAQGLPHAWFCGFAPFEHPRLAFVIFLEHGGKGGEQAAFVARDLLAYFKELEYL